MPKKEFDRRFLLDYSFYNEIVTKSAYLSPSLFYKLTCINANSKEYPREHNLMSKESFTKIVEEKMKKDNEFDRPVVESFLKAGFKPLAEPEVIEKIKDEIERNIKYAITLATKTPFATIIFTTENNLETYKSNPHYEGIKNISVIAGNETLNYLNKCWQDVKRID